MTNHIDALIEEALEKDLRWLREVEMLFGIDDLRAVAARAYYKGRADGNQEAYSLQEDACRDLARELMRAWDDNKLLDKLREIAEEGE